jgi:hypothetical protein
MANATVTFEVKVTATGDKPPRRPRRADDD